MFSQICAPFKTRQRYENIIWSRRGLGSVHEMSRSFQVHSEEGPHSIVEAPHSAKMLTNLPNVLNRSAKMFETSAAQRTARTPGFSGCCWYCAAPGQTAGTPRRPPERAEFAKCCQKVAAFARCCQIFEELPDPKFLRYITQRQPCLVFRKGFLGRRQTVEARSFSFAFLIPPGFLGPRRSLEARTRPSGKKAASLQ